MKKGQSGPGGGIADAFNDNILKLRLSPGWNTQYYRWYRAGYAQDDWKVNSKLTINLGVRYDFIEPMTNNAGDRHQLHSHSRRALMQTAMVMALALVRL